jgi:hypothetical protein
MGLRGVRREMQIGKQDLAFAQPHPFGSLRLLHLHDHVRLDEDLVGGLGDRGTSGAIDLVVCADA